MQYETDQIIEFLDILLLLVIHSCWNLSLFNVYINRVITLDICFNINDGISYIHLFKISLIIRPPTYLF